MAVRRTTLFDQVASEIITLIEESDLKPGDEIPPEGELAARFGVNRLAVREAIRALAAREILVSSQGRRARVNVPTARVFGQILGFRLRQQSLRFEDVLDARGAVEGAMASRAAVRVGAGAASTDDATALLEKMEEAVDDRDRFVALDLAFHHEIARTADNGILELVLESLGDVLTEHRLASYDGRSLHGESQQDTITAHRAILDAITAGDPEGAVAAMAAHLTETGEDLEITP
ncbi:FadR/GntR family transcriptional regulator [Streptomyces sp. NPDC050529]|uniref:FCD domain-containing protein n=1 Tax=Streptomyces laculatispora TaxID=887464 RepID=A0ABY9HXC2_9ACTN|nr:MULTISPECIES: FCD domain-containing protein [Streptomyces]WLQ39004.1 FCD domain-containing protein [Streptomyces laculatispora]WRZ79249.1 FCD domain-containing protein [Streptomyces sp. NBC_01022]WRZ86427.1 FCD domain-containing protein [Streptomyces sp. NBC_01022]WSY80541.1 FCD domain-containing protein [Streptomyces sp. NBC_00876]